MGKRRRRKKWTRRIDLLDPAHTNAIEARVFELCVNTGLATPQNGRGYDFVRCRCARGIALLSTVDDNGQAMLVIDAHPATMQVRP